MNGDPSRSLQVCIRPLYESGGNGIGWLSAVCCFRSTVIAAPCRVSRHPSICKARESPDNARDDGEMARREDMADNEWGT